MPDDDVIRLDIRPPVKRWMRWLLAVWVVLVIAQVVFAVGDDSPNRSYVSPMLNVLLAFSFWFNHGRSQEVVVDADGVNLPLRRLIPWSQVTGVKEPGRFDSVVELKLEGGKVRHTGLPPEYAEQVARIGGVPLE